MGCILFPARNAERFALHSAHLRTFPEVIILSVFDVGHVPLGKVGVQPKSKMLRYCGLAKGGGIPPISSSSSH